MILTARELPLPGTAELAEHIARSALIAGLLGAFGVAIGALVRNQVVAIVSLLLLALVIEPAVLALAPEVGRFGPIGALTTALSGIPAQDAGLGDVDLLAPGVALLAMLAWIGSAFAAGAALLHRRDVD